MKKLAKPTVSCYDGMPTTLRIGCYQFRVEVTDFEDSEAERTFGHMNPLSQKIRLRPGMTSQNLANTWLHEVMHALHWFMEAGQGKDMDDMEEDYTSKGASGLCLFFQMNPDAVNWWMKINQLGDAP
jgi:hypothetical protein